jgi:basic amino acid/polyamine antiporter, APA family
MGVWMLALYGLGSMLGAGIYALVGRAAEVAGSAVWMAFLTAMVGAMLTGLTYAALGARYPHAGGAAYVVHRAFRRPTLSYVVGLAVVASGLTSMATGSRVIADNLRALFGLEAVPPLSLALAYLAVLAVLVWRGLKESLWFNAMCSVIEAGGLVLVIVCGARFWGSRDLLELPGTSPGLASAGLLVASASVLTFFAFMGFEDTLNVTEEVRDPARTVPRGLILAMLGAAVLYLLVSITAVSVVPWRELARAPAPLGAVMSRAAPWIPPPVYVVITMFAVANTALINFVMGSRLVYGMARQGLLPAPLARVHAVRHTPHRAVLAIYGCAAVVVSLGDISQLASATVLLLLGVFVVMNVSHLVLARRAGEPPAPFVLPGFVPFIGALLCGAVFSVRALTGDAVAPLIAAGIVAASLVLYALTRQSRGTTPASS